MLIVIVVLLVKVIAIVLEVVIIIGCQGERPRASVRVRGAEARQGRRDGGRQGKL